MEVNTTIENVRIVNAMGNQPPYWILKFLRGFCPPQMLEEIEGDLLQKFGRDVRPFGEGKAKWRLIWSVMRFFRPGIVLRNQLHSYKGLGLFYSYGKTTYRRLKKQPLQTTLSLLSITIGLSAFLWIYLFAFSEYSYDKHITDADNLYRVTMTWKSEGDLNDTPLGWSVAQLPEQLRSSFPEVKAATGLAAIKGKAKVNTSIALYLEDGFYTTDTSYFKVFNHTWLAGNPARLNESSVVLTESLAKKYFDNENMLGRVLEINGELFTIAGVIKDSPANTSFRIQALLFTFNASNTDWCFSFFNLHTNSNQKIIQQKIDTLFNDEYKDILKQSNTEGAFQVEPLTSVHFGEFKMMDVPKGNDVLLFILLGIGSVILFAAVANYVQLNYSFAEARQKEASIRSTMGALSNDSLTQNIFESITLGLIATSFSLFLIYFGWSYLDGYELKDYAFSSSEIVSITFLIVGSILAIGVLSGYGNYYRLSLSSIIVRKKSLAHSWGREWNKSMLLIFQFSVSLSLVFASLAIINQLNQLKILQGDIHQNEILIIDIPQEQTEPFLNKFNNSLKQLSFVSQTSFVGSGTVPSSEPAMDIFKIESSRSSVIQTLEYLQVDPNYFELFNIDVIAGRIYTDQENGSWEKAVVNQAFLIRQGWNKDPLNHKLSYGSMGEPTPILGVVNDERILTFHLKEKPLIYFPLIGTPEKLIVKLSSVNYEHIEQVKRLWTAIIQQPFEYEFLNYFIEKQLHQQKRIERQIFFFAIAAILLISTGLLGAVQLQLAVKKKQSAIRRILGARLLELIRIGWQNQFLCFFLASVITYPVSHFILRFWQFQFPIKIESGFLIFLLAAMIHLIILFMVAFYYGWKLNKIKPLEIIKYE